MPRTDLLIQDAPWELAYNFQLREYHNDGSYSYIDSITMKKREPGELCNPGFQLERESVQFLMDRMWELGIRPSKGVSSAGQEEAMKEHIKDLQKTHNALIQLATR